MVCAGNDREVGMSDRDIELQEIALQAEDVLRYESTTGMAAARALAIAFQVEERIQELDAGDDSSQFWWRYINALSRIINKAEWAESSTLDQVESLFHASPEQRCRAALECMKEKAKAVGG